MGFYQDDPVSDPGGGEEGLAQISTEELCYPVGTGFEVSICDPRRAGQQIEVTIGLMGSQGQAEVVQVTLDAQGNGSFPYTPSSAGVLVFDCGNGGMMSVTIY